MVNEAAIAEAIADLNTQESPNFAATAKKYKIDRCTLQRRFTGKHAEIRKAHLETQGKLTAAMERVLVERINTLSARGMPPTVQFVKNLVAEMVREEVGKHWVPRFVRRHEDELEIAFLEGIDYARRIADNSRHFRYYFENVGLLLRFLYI